MNKKILIHCVKSDGMFTDQFLLMLRSVAVSFSQSSVMVKEYGESLAQLNLTVKLQLRNSHTQYIHSLTVYSH